MGRKKKVTLSIVAALIGLFLLWWVYLIVDQNINPPVTQDGRKSGYEWQQKIEKQRRQ